MRGSAERRPRRSAPPAAPRARSPATARTSPSRSSGSTSRSSCSSSRRAASSTERAAGSTRRASSSRPQSTRRARSSASPRASGGGSLTAAFLHYGLIHLGMNMLVLWFIGPPLEEYFGHCAVPARLRRFRARGLGRRADLVSERAHRGGVGRDLGDHGRRARPRSAQDLGLRRSGDGTRRSSTSRSRSSSPGSRSAATSAGSSAAGCAPWRSRASGAHPRSRRSRWPQWASRASRSLSPQVA